MRTSILFLLTAAAAFCQPPKIGVIDFYGRHKTPEALLRRALTVKEGDPLPKSKGDIEDALEAVPNVVQARLEAFCCEDGKAVLYVGIVERGAPHFDFITPPSGTAELPEEIHQEYAAFVAAVNSAVRQGGIQEDLSTGHSMMSAPGARAHQERFLELAAGNLAKIRAVLKESADEEQRAIAAYVIGYVPLDREEAVRDVVNDLQAALRDPDDTVRNNAARSLGALAVYASRNPEAGIKISPTWLIEMLNSLIWADRTGATNILVTMTEKRDKDLLDRIRPQAEGLAEMARWKHLAHALPSFILLGRLAGEDEANIQKAWAAADRNNAIQQWERRVAPPSK